jgi:hypothetical protein
MEGDSMTHTHGTVIVCERVDGATHAWVDEEASEQVPEDWFVEWWHDAPLAYAGRMSGGYVMQTYVNMATVRLRRHWMDWQDAAAWCRRQARRYEQARKVAA